MAVDGIICSIVIPLYNGERFIGKTLGSCLAQTIASSIEIVVIDDASTDRSLEIARSVTRGCPNVRICGNPANLGITRTIVTGVEMSRGEFLLLLGHDDLLRPAHVEIMLAEFDRRTALVHCSSDQIDERDNISETRSNRPDRRLRTKDPLYLLAFDNFICSTGAIIRKSLYESSGGMPTEFRNYGEWMLWIKLAAVGDLKYTSRTKALYRRHSTNITNTFDQAHVREGLERYFSRCRREAVARHHSLGRARIILRAGVIMPISAMLRRVAKRVLSVWIAKTKL